jgi:hypothetical protein
LEKNFNQHSQTETRVILDQEARSVVPAYHVCYVEDRRWQLQLAQGIRNQLFLEFFADKLHVGFVDGLVGGGINGYVLWLPKTPFSGFQPDVTL